MHWEPLIIILKSNNTQVFYLININYTYKQIQIVFDYLMGSMITSKSEITEVMN